jgi:hypothetical protein
MIYLGVLAIIFWVGILCAVIQDWRYCKRVERGEQSE